jgi:hypothetical protein
MPEPDIGWYYSITSLAMTSSPGGISEASPPALKPLKPIAIIEP